MPLPIRARAKTREQDTVSCRVLAADDVHIYLVTHALSPSLSPASVFRRLQRLPVYHLPGDRRHPYRVFAADLFGAIVHQDDAAYADRPGDP